MNAVGILNDGWLIVLSLTALSDSMSVYIEQSTREKEKEEI